MHHLTSLSFVDAACYAVMQHFRSESSALSLCLCSFLCCYASLLDHVDPKGAALPNSDLKLCTFDALVLKVRLPRILNKWASRQSEQFFFSIRPSGVRIETGLIRTVGRAFFFMADSIRIDQSRFKFGLAAIRIAARMSDPAVAIFH